MKTLLTISMIAFLLTTHARGEIKHFGASGQNLYVRVQTGTSTFVACALTEGPHSGMDFSGAGVYTAADSDLHGAGLTSANFDGYSFTVRSSATPSTSANDPIVGFGQIAWNGIAEVPIAVNVMNYGGGAGHFSVGRPEVLDGTLLHRDLVFNADSSTELILGGIHSVDGALTGCLIVLHDSGSGSDATAVRRITNQTIDGAGRPVVTLDSAPPFADDSGTQFEVLAARATAADLTSQDIADAMKLAPGAGTPSAGSVQARLQGTLAANVTQFGGTSGTFSGGRPEVNTTHIAGTAQTARDIGASVLLSSGTGTGQLLLSSGNIAGSVGSINGITFPTNFSGLTITSGRVSADVTHWLGTGVTTTVDGVPQVDITHVLGSPVCH